MYAGFWKRLCAYFLDSIILYFSSWIVIVLLMPVMGVASVVSKMAMPFGSDLRDHEEMLGVFGITLFLVFYLSPFIFHWLYYAIMESSKCRATVGKLALGIIVVDENNEKVSFGRASARYWSGIFSFLTLFVGYIMAGFTAKKQALHDKIARTYVVNKNWLEYMEYMKRNPTMPEAPVPAPAPGVNRLSIPLNKEEQPKL
jgi:uncharacterized RDD family membrane protein YckC